MNWSLPGKPASLEQPTLLNGPVEVPLMTAPVEVPVEPPAPAPVDPPVVPSPGGYTGLMKTPAPQAVVKTEQERTRTRCIPQPIVNRRKTQAAGSTTTAVALSLRSSSNGICPSTWIA